MPAISRIRLTNIIYEDGNKRFNNEIYTFDGHNTTFILENGGGKTVLLHTVLQGVLPHVELEERKIKNTLKLDEGPAHIAIEWILKDNPRRYLVTCVSLFLTKGELDSYRYVYEYGPSDNHAMEYIKFTQGEGKSRRPSERAEIQEYYAHMKQQSMHAKTFTTIREFKQYIEEQYQIITKEWEGIVKINSSEGGVEKFFDNCKTTGQLFDRLLIPAIEDSMGGHSDDRFASIFEKRRDNFKQYKQLKEKITENEKIKQQLESYVRHFEVLHERQGSYDETRQQAKSHMLWVQAEQQLEVVEQEQIQQLFVEQQQAEVELNRKKASYEIALEQQKLTDITSQHADETHVVERIETALQRVTRLHASYRLAKYRQEYQLEQAILEVAEKELQSINQNPEVEQLQEEWLTNKRQLQGYFLTRKEQLQKKIAEQAQIKQQLQGKIEQKESKYNELHLQSIEIGKQLAVTQSEQERMKDRMEQIAKEIIANPLEQTVKQAYQLWLHDQSRIDEEIQVLRGVIKQQIDDKIQLTELRDGLQEEYEKRADQQSKWEQHFIQHEQQQANLKHILGERQARWGQLESIYTKADSVANTIADSSNRLEQEREQLLYQERLSFRHVDDYQHQDVFFADSYLEQQVQKWKGQFTYLVTGTEYLHNLQQESSTDLWPLVVITTDKEVPKLQERIERIDVQIQYPIEVLSVNQARERLESDRDIETHTHRNRWLLPSHWRLAEDQQQFNQWQQDSLETAQGKKKERQMKEEELAKWIKAGEALSDFMQKNPYEIYVENKEQLRSLQGQQQQTKIAIQTAKKRLTEIDMESEQKHKKMEQHQESLKDLGTYITKAQEHMKLDKERQEGLQDLLQQESAMKQVDQDMRSYKRMIEDFQAELQEINQLTQDTIRDFDVLVQGDLYKEVIDQQDLEPQYTELLLPTLKQERYRIQRALDQTTNNRKELEIQIAGLKKQLKQLHEAIHTIKQEHPYVDETLEFPVDGEERLEQLWQDKQQYEKQLKPKQQQLLALQKEKDQLEARIRILQEQYEGKYTNQPLSTFTQHLEVIKGELEEETKRLQEQDKQVRKRKKRSDHQRENIDKAYGELDRYEPKHRFMTSSIPERVLTDAEGREFAYQRLQTVAKIIQQLDAHHEHVSKQQRQINLARDEFREFCNQNIRDTKLKERTIQGIEFKHTYEDVLAFKQATEQGINRSIQIAEDHMINHDKELEQFIIYLQTHVRKIADELKIIPKKTKVKIDEQWKEIYSIVVPDWDQQQGKLEIRQYIEDLVTHIEQERYLDKDGKEEPVKIRKAIESWLQSKNLLQIVMQKQQMKITLHKVTNDNRLSSRRFNWEQSNQWSGGEKWSKNMTLFLGLLNYIAEKYQDIPAGKGRTRAVLLDNPFGKASSDHVLSPVFFIAEQLGFQLIALTAHADGKFLRDYFPILYSLRLRSAVGTDKQVMDTRKEINQAYFRDHQPQTLERLAATEQLELF